MTKLKNKKARKPGVSNPGIGMRYRAANIPETGQYAGLVGRVLAVEKPGYGSGLNGDHVVMRFDSAKRSVALLSTQIERP